MHIEGKILILLESCHLIRRKHTSVYYLKLCISNRGKTLLFRSQSINFSSWTIFNLITTSKPTNDTQGIFKQALVWLQALHVDVNILCKKSKPFIDSFQRYWWSTNPAIRLEERLFWSINWNSVYHFKEKNSSFRNQYLIKTFFNLTMSPRPIKVKVSVLAFFTVSMRNIYITWSLPEILMIKESCSLTGRQYFGQLTCEPEFSSTRGLHSKIENFFFHLRLLITSNEYIFQKL